MADEPWKAKDAKAQIEAMAADAARRKAELEQARQDATPVMVVGLRIPFNDVVALLFQLLCAQLLFAAIIGALALGLHLFGAF